MNLTLEKISATSEILPDEPLLRKAIFVAFDGCCFYSGRPLEIDDFHIDHVVPVASGGENAICNYVASCHQINLSKSDRHNGKFSEVVRGIVSLIYAPKVMRILKDLLVDIDGMVRPNEFLRDNGISAFSNIGIRFRSKIQTVKPLCVKRKGEGKARGIVYFFVKDLEKILNSVKGHGEHIARRSVNQPSSANV
jgi:hypothetical protein